MTTDAYIRWFLGSVGNMLIFCALISRRAWIDLRALAMVEMISFGVVLSQNINRTNYTAWLWTDYTGIAIYLALCIALHFYELHDQAAWLPPLYFVNFALNSMQIKFGFEATRPTLYIVRIWIKIFVSFLMCYCLFTHKIVSKEPHNDRS